MNPCAICGYAKGGAPEGHRYCVTCDATLALTRPLNEQIERRRPAKLKRTDEGVYSPWSLKYWVGA